jgi:hypothetical protein
MSRRRNAITDQFVPHTRGMLESPAYRVLSRAAFLVLARIELEHMNHGGNENGNLPVTYDDFVRYGVHRHSIAPAVRELAELGFIQITERGCAGNREFRSPNKYRLTYRPAKNAHGDGSHEWRFIESLEQAEAIARRARGIDKTSISVSKQMPGEEVSQDKTTVTKNANFQCRKPSSTAPGSQWRKSSPRPQ